MLVIDAPVHKNAPAGFGRSEVDVLKFFAAGGGKIVDVVVNLVK